MDWRFFFVGCCWMVWSCQSPMPEPAPAVSLPQPAAETPVAFFEESNAAAQRFSPLLDTAYDWQSDSFLMALCQTYDLPTGTTIARLERHPLYGYADTLFWVETIVPTAQDSLCPHPIRRQQLLFDATGQLIHQNKANMAQFLPDAVDSLPLYLEAFVNCEGQGTHQVYRYENKALIPVLDPLMEHPPITYDIHPDSFLLAGGALTPRLQDLNADGHLDLLLEGRLVYLYSPRGQRYSAQRPYKRVRIAHHFVYAPAKEYFVWQPSH